MTTTLPILLHDVDWRSSRALSSAWEFRSRPGVVERPPAAAAASRPPLAPVHAAAWKSGAREETSETLQEEAADNQTGVKEKRKKHKDKGIASKRKEKAGAVRRPTSSRQRLPQRGMKPSNRSAAVKTRLHLERGRSTAALILRRDSDGGPESQRALGKLRQAAKNSGKSVQVGKKPHANLSEDRLLESPGSSDRRKAAAREDGGGGWCRRFRDQDFPDGDRRPIRTGPGLRFPPWLSRDDVRKMELLAEGAVVSKARVPAHGQVLRVALDAPAQQQVHATRTLSFLSAETRTLV